MERVTKILLMAYLLVGCLGLPCYAATLSDSSHACCGQETTQQSACCDTEQALFSDAPEAPSLAAVVVEIVTHDAAPATTFEPTPESQHPPPQPPRSRPDLSRAPPF